MELPHEIIEEFENLPETHKIYYDDAYIKEFDSKVIGIKNLEDYAYVVLESTAFYPEGGGQEGDQGTLKKSDVVFNVLDTQAIDERVVVHICERRSVELKIGDMVHGVINWDLRYNRMRHHTGSHLVFSSTREILGVKRLIYKGVYVGDRWGRIDINYDSPISDEQILSIEKLANEIIMENRPVHIKFMDRYEAERIYGDKLGMTEVTPTGKVRVVEIEDFDYALCGGTHVKSTAEVGLIRILEHYKLAKGVHRIRFAVGMSAYENYHNLLLKLFRISRALNTSLEEVDMKIKSLIRKNKDLEKQINRLRKRFAKYEARELIEKADKVGDLLVIVSELSETDMNHMQLLLKHIVSSHQEAVVIFATKNERVFIIGGVGEKAIEDGVRINELVEDLKAMLDGKGGGSPRRIQIVGARRDRLKDALDLAKNKILNMIKS